MKKTLIALTVIGGLFAAHASAASYAGVSVGTGGVSGQYQTGLDAKSALRGSLGVGWSGGGVNAGVDYLSRFNTAATTGNALQPYFGAGVGVGFGGGVGITPRAFVGAELPISTGANTMRAFAEVGPALSIVTANSGSTSVSGTSFGLHARAGVNFRLN